MTSQGFMGARRSRVVPMVAMGCLVLASGLLLSQSAAGQDAGRICETALSRADSSYVVGHFDEAISLLEYCLDQELLPAQDEIDAYLLIAKAHQRQDRNSQARVAIRIVLERDPDHMLDPVRETPGFRQLFDDMRRDMGLYVAGAEDETLSPATDPAVVEVESSRPVWRRWLIAGGGAVLAGSVAAVLISGGGGNGGGTSDAWPRPPGRPGQ